MNPSERSEPEHLAGSRSGERRSEAEPASTVGERSEPEQHGTVTQFDEYVGLGTVTAADGSEHLFHCVEIADGSRTIAVGTEVEFALLPKLGRYEAGGVSPVSG